MALAVTSAPSAVTRSTETRLSQASPYLRSIHPEPPPSVKPATPVVDTRPPVIGEPVLLRGAVELAPEDTRTNATTAGGRRRP